MDATLPRSLARCGATIERRHRDLADRIRADHSWIDVPVFDARGRVVQRRGVTEGPGLSFLGLSRLHSRGSALLGWVKDDAEHLVREIAALQPTASTATAARRRAARDQERA